MLRIALTGGAATGKSYVLNRFRLAGVPILVADDLAHGVTAAGTESTEAIAARFRAEQQEADRRDPEMPVDYIWEIPIELANSLCRYRHDQHADWGKPELKILAEGKA